MIKRKDSLGHKPHKDNTWPENAKVPDSDPASTEIGGRDGPEPTRYKDWEKNGRCIDF